MVKKRKIFRKGPDVPVPIGQELDLYLEKIGGAREKGGLASLWRDWEKIMGPEIAAMTAEVFARKKTLVLRTFDSMLMQELLFQKEFLLAQANAFLGSAYFEKVSLVV